MTDEIRPYERPETYQPSAAPLPSPEVSTAIALAERLANARIDPAGREADANRSLRVYVDSLDAEQLDRVVAAAAALVCAAVAVTLGTADGHHG